MKQILIFTLFASALFFGCSKYSEENVLNDTISRRTFVAHVEDNQTRLHAQKPYIIWDENDAISVIDGENNLLYYYLEGEFCPSNNNVEVSDGQVYAVYPYDENNSVTDGKFSLTLPANQSYAENSFGDGANTMVAVSNGDDLYFKNVGGYIELKLYGNDVTVKSIKFEGNSGEQLSGNVIVSFDGDGNPIYEWNPASSNAETKVVTLTCPDEGVKIGATSGEATSFWIVVPPHTFNNGFTITVTDKDGNSFVKSTTKKITLDRNHLKPMAVLEFVSKPKAGELYYYKGSDKGEMEIPESGELSMSHFLPIEINPESLEPVVSDNLLARMEITKIEIPEGITSIGAVTFAYCTKLEEVVLPSTLQSIEMGAFGGCESLRNITIPSSVQTIGDMAFLMSGLEGELIIPDGVKTLGMSAFAQTNIEKVVIPDSVTGSIHSTFMGCTNLTDVTIGSGITELNHTVFSGCTSLESIVIPKTVLEIEEGVFADCTSLSNVEFEEGSQLRFIWMDTFCNCTSLERIVLPASLGVPQSGYTSGLGASLFKGCTKLKYVYSLSETPIKINDFTVTDISDKDYNYPFPYTNEGFKIYVPNEAARTAYLEDPLWMEVGNERIVVGSPE